MNEQISRTRPQFLTVLCILSFIGIGFALISEISTWSYIQKMMYMMAQADGSMTGSFGHDIMMRKWGVVLGTLTLPICFIGVLLMWKLKRNGFFIYALGELAMPIIGVIFLGFSGPGFQTASMIIGGLVAVAFVIMYGLNLKHMR